MTEPRKLYLASSFKYASLVAKLSKMLEAEGYEITQKWWLKDYKQIAVPDGEWYNREDVKAIFQRNFESIKKADALVLVSVLDEEPKFNGANVELGYALALGKSCLSIGTLCRSAMYVPVNQCSEFSELLVRLKEVLK